ncbi:MAG: hypothetical protein WBJ06_02970 [Candidatus Methanoculleus thermohydrogenotrophicum]|jgi:hypothetical protein|nr:hypothetical protein [Candidatus Methanoculleus thermohydrogenotrophicum]
MKREYDRLLRASGWIPVSCALATNSRFHLVLVTGYVPGTSIRELLAAGSSLYDPLTGVAHLLRRLHDNTRTSCDREREFAYFHEVLDQNRLPAHQREWFNRLLGAWWHSTRIGQDEGCMARGDATPGNYLYDGGAWAIDFEGVRDHAHRIRDPGILAAEIKASAGGMSGLRTTSVTSSGTTARARWRFAAIPPICRSSWRSATSDRPAALAGA